MRRCEAKSGHKRPSPAALFETLVDKKVLTEAHDYKDLPESGQGILRNAALPRTAFTSKGHSPSIMTVRWAPHVSVQAFRAQVGYESGIPLFLCHRSSP